MAERAALHILADESNRRSLDQKASQRQRLGGGPSKGALAAIAICAGGENSLQLWIDREVRRQLAEPFPDFAQRIRRHRRLRGPVISGPAVSFPHAAKGAEILPRSLFLGLGLRF